MPKAGGTNSDLGSAQIQDPRIHAKDGISQLGTQLAMSSSDVFESCLISVKQVTGAETVSLLADSITGRGSEALLIHEGKIAPVPELMTKSAALKYVSEVDARMGKTVYFCRQPVVYLHESASNDGYLIAISISRFLSSLREDQRLESQRERRKPGPNSLDVEDDDFVWIGLRYHPNTPLSILQRLSSKPASAGDGVAEESVNWLISTLCLGGYMAWRTYRLSDLMGDPISGLPGRVEFQVYLRQAVDEAERKGQSLGLMLVNPDEFAVINQRLDRETGDLALAEVAEQLLTCVRRSDAVFRYGGAVFAAVLPQAGWSDLGKACEKIRHELTGAFLDGTVRLAFSVGAALYETGHESNLRLAATELLRQANHALNLAKVSGGGRTVLWNPDSADAPVASLDRLSGIFTADTEKDYRNMLLLWDTIAIISSAEEMEIIATAFVDRISSIWKSIRVALFEEKDDGKSQLLAASCTATNDWKNSEGSGLALSEKQKELLSKVREQRRTERLRLGGAEGDEQAANRTVLAYAVPLVAREQYLGCLYIEGPEDCLALDSSDLIFLNALASQVGLALDRAGLALRWKREKERESQQLRQEVRELRQVLHSARLVYCSAQMQSVLDTLHAVAATDVTVLITGESGTGKEMLAKSLHEQSTRHKQPFITVDCGAIAHSLMEAELFGHVKGAYTGAEGSSEGRVVEAEGGTLFLDEIGEIPLHIQVKLLRFVQEKEINPVGATRSRRVDVRIVAATNRDLSKEVQAGRFRGDLYYRLQVVTVTSPPLRERPDDILPLASHFLEKFAIQYEKGIRRLSPNAESTLLAYRWPGNVRELQNSILRAVVMSTTEKISRSDLRLDGGEVCQLGETEQLVPVIPERVPLPDSQLIDVVNPVIGGQQQPGQSDFSENPDDPWQELRRGLESQVMAAIDSSTGVPVPLGRWLTEDLVLAADSAASGVARRGALTLGLAETTFRRHLRKVKHEALAGLLSRTPAWSSLKPILPHLIASPDVGTEQNVIDRARQILLGEIVVRVPDDSALGSALMGVTVPTYRRWTDLVTS